MIDNKAIADARRFFRRVADSGWGYLIRKRKEQTPLEEIRAEAERIYRQGIQHAWAIYTKDNEIVKQANDTLRKAINQANELYFKDEERISDAAYARAKNFFVKAIRQAHDDYAITVDQIWKTFVKDMKRIPESDSKNGKENVCACDR